MDEPKSVMRERIIMVETYRFFCRGLCTINLTLACAIPAIEYISSQNVGKQSQKARIVRIGFEAHLRMLAGFEGLFRRGIRSIG
jgi:hypothetical protein